MYCTSWPALTSVSGHYSRKGVKLTTNLRVVMSLGMRGALPRLVHTPAVIQQCIIKQRANVAFTLQADAMAGHDTGFLPSPHSVAISLITACPVIAQKIC
jgi:hypothetical protein